MAHGEDQVRKPDWLLRLSIPAFVTFLFFSALEIGASPQVAASADASKKRRRNKLVLGFSPNRVVRHSG